MYTLCSKIPQVAPTFAELFGIPPALNVAQILLVDIGTDILTAVAYAYQPAEESLMSEKPRHPLVEQMVNWKVLVYSYGYFGWLQMLSCWVAFSVSPAVDLYGIPQHEWSSADRRVGRTGMAAYYTTLVSGQIAAALATTTTRQSLFSYGLPNKVLNACIVGEILVAYIAVTWDPLQNAFELGDLPMSSLGVAVIGMLFMTALEELRKAVLRRRDSQPSSSGYDQLLPLESP
jgi:sodium/potassium-transporting ATPase subunit alpha